MAIDINIKKTFKICLVVVNEFSVLLLRVKTEKPGIRLEQNICRKKKHEV